MHSAMTKCNDTEALTFELPRIVSTGTVDEDSMIGGVEHDVEVVLHELAAIEATEQHEE